eukprot:CAMPEP_0201117048 /NCGR_PEP_ID=MMETSP0850-20130426/1147_1 /ASSEMBLY_ACC=CAM_ASM_000622 /TAXON_ID=183588 /ORGANISM="Pseudo-nitzschia fraudulenta, Strain WWA7" /LENGTH=568 /DNA_ID=CAMNT_0047381285 /DNA_START=202 /DNA_END=1908 /DNA_ORIENTATION=-
MYKEDERQQSEENGHQAGNGEGNKHLIISKNSSLSKDEQEQQPRQEDQQARQQQERQRALEPQEQHQTQDHQEHQEYQRHQDQQEQIDPQEKHEYEEQAYQERTMANCEQPLKLIVRSQFWGRELKGRACRNVATKGNVRAPCVISSQAILYNKDGFWGCCPDHGKRVLELQEDHFSEACEGNWHLHHKGTWCGDGVYIHEYLLLPEEQTLVDMSRNDSWLFVGVCAEGDILRGLDSLVRPVLKRNDEFSNRHTSTHVHIDIMMDSVRDKETPRSRKVNNDKIRAARANRQAQTCEGQGTSVVTEGASSNEQLSSERVNTPPGGGNGSLAPASMATKFIGTPREEVPREVTMQHQPALPCFHPAKTRPIHQQYVPIPPEHYAFPHPQCISPGFTPLYPPGQYQQYPPPNWTNLHTNHQYVPQQYEGQHQVPMVGLYSFVPVNPTNWQATSGYGYHASHQPYQPWNPTNDVGWTPDSSPQVAHDRGSDGPGFLQQQPFPPPTDMVPASQSLAAALDLPDDTSASRHLSPTTTPGLSDTPAVLVSPNDSTGPPSVGDTESRSMATQQASN